MPAPTHAIVEDNLLFRLDALRAAALGGRPIEERGRLVLEVCTRLRRLGLVALLARGDVRAYAADLHASAQEYLRLLGQVRWDAVGDRYWLCASRAHPFFDALAVEDWEGAGAIAAAAAPVRSPGDEFADDFAFVRRVMAMAGPSSPDAEARLMAQLEAEAAESDPRVGVCRALHEKDADGFEEALARLAREREAKVAARVHEVGVEGAWHATERFVYVEGLALVRVAARRGLTLEGRYPGLPALALGPMPRPFPTTDAWRKQ